MSPFDRRQRAELRRELEPDILPRQLRALERVAERLDDARPQPAPGFRAALDERIEALANRDGGPIGTRWLVPALAAVAAGLLLLLIATALAL